MVETGDGNRDTDEHRWAALMVHAQAGAESDYQQLLGELSEAINRYLCSRIGHHHFIEDCVQDILIAIHEARHTYDSRRLFRPWLFAIVRHKTVDALRRNNSYNKALKRQYNSAQVSAQASGANSLDAHLDQGRLLSALSPRYREAITLTKIIGLSTAEAATELGISNSALKVRVHRAIGQLRQLLEADEL